MEIWSPTGTDIVGSVQNIFSKRYLTENLEIPKIKYEYVFDGELLWYYKPNIPLTKEYLRLIHNGDEEKRLELLSIIYENSNNSGADLNGLRESLGFPKITLSQYLDQIKDIVGQKSSLGYPEDKII